MADQLDPKRTVIRFLEGWKHQEWPICLSYVQITWKNDTDARDTGFLNKLKNLFGAGRSNISAMELLQRRLEEHELRNIRRVEIEDPPGLNKNVIKDAIAEVTFADGRIGTIRLRLVCEKSPYQADPAGTWGVNPNSIRSV